MNYQDILLQKRLNNPVLDLHLILKKIFSQPSIMIITGEWKSGKTDTALLFAVDFLLSMGIVSKVGSNIRCKSDPRVEYVADVETLRYWLHKDRLLKMYIFDEAIKHAYKRTPMARTQVSLIQVVTELSKGHARGIIIAQDPTMVDKDLLNPLWCKALVVKKGFYDRDKLDVRAIPASLIPGGGYRKFSGIPRTSVKFDPYEEAEFDEASEIPLMSNPQFLVFYRYTQGDTMKKIAQAIREDQDWRNAIGVTYVDETVVKKIIRRVAKAMMFVCLPKAGEVDKAISKDSKRP